MTGFDVIIIGAAVNRKVAGSSSFSSVGIVGHLIGSNHVTAVVNLGVTAKFVYIALFFLLPSIPLWVSFVVLVLSHEIQQLSHKIYTIEYDMTAYKAKYRKGVLLFVLLSLYELPILLNYLVFEGSRSFSPQAVPRVKTPAVEQPSHAVVALPK